MTTVSVRVVDDRVAVAKLGSVVDFGRHPGELLDQELADEPRVPRRAARDQRHLVDRAEVVVGERHLVEEHVTGVARHAAQNRFADGRRLLEDLLEHEVLVAGLLGLHGIPRDALRLLLDRSRRRGL